MAKGRSKGIGLNVPQATCAPYRPSKQDVDREKRWRAESDLRTLREAESVKSDPSRVRMAQQVAREEMKALAKVTKK